MNIQLGNNPVTIKELASSIPGIQPISKKKNSTPVPMPEIVVKATQKQENPKHKELIESLQAQNADLSQKLAHALEEIEIANEDLYKTEKFLSLIRDLKQAQEATNFLQDENELLRNKVYISSINSDKDEVLRLKEEIKALKIEKDAAWMASPEYLKKLKERLETEETVRSSLESELRRVKKTMHNTETDLKFELAQAQKEIVSLKDLLAARDVSKVLPPNKNPIELTKSTPNDRYTADDLPLPKSLFDSYQK